MLSEDSALNESIKSETRIDLSSYITDDLRQRIDNAISFPAAASFNMTMLPLIMGVVAFLFGAFLIWKFSIIMGALLILAAMTTVPVMGLSFGTAATMGRLVDDSEGLFDEALFLLQKIAIDLPNLKQFSSEMAKTSPKDLMTATTKVVLIPVLADRIMQRIPLFGARFAKASSAMLQKMIDGSDYKPKEMPHDAGTFAANVEEYAINTRQRAQKLANGVRGWVVTPFTRTAWIILILHIVFFAFMAIPHFL